MDREIKFRGKRIDNDKWVVGNYIEKIKPTEKEPVFWCSLIQDRAISVYEVYPKSVGQFTGLKDKNGKEIYEGDILKADNWFFNWIVQFDKIKARFNCIVNKEGSRNEFIPPSHVEIIGNIYENPDLIK
jgi:uncharacterized phage protein (TIGR01671 family)